MDSPKLDSTQASEFTCSTTPKKLCSNERFAMFTVMSRPRKAKTRMEQMGFFDPDLKKPEHDDMIIWIHDNIEEVLTYAIPLQKRPNWARAELECVIKQSSKDDSWILGFADIVAKFGNLDTLEHEYALIEAKTSIESLGELLRQMNSYREGWFRGIAAWKMTRVVVCPDDTHAGIIRQQGIAFLKFDQNLKFTGGL